jgi:hypothetical protein
VVTESSQAAYRSAYREDGKSAGVDPDLTRIVKAWPSLPGSIRRAVLELVAQGEVP